MTRVSVVTPSFNQVHLLAGAIENVRTQAGADVEHIVIDGGSTDGTVDMLRSYGNLITWVSEPDHGQADAINKGFGRARGDILAWLNCDDRYTPGALNLVRRVFDDEPSTRFLFGDALGVDPKGRDYGVRAHVRACTRDDLVHHGDPIVQPAAFWRRDLWDEVGTLDASFTYAFDYEYWMRVADVTVLRYVQVCLAIESLHGDAKTSRGERPRMAEIALAASRHGGEGVPYGFRAEAAAIESWAALASAIHVDLPAARGHLAGALALRPPFTRYLLHGLARAVPGTFTVPRLRLVSNRIRSRRAPVLPAEALLEWEAAL